MLAILLALALTPGANDAVEARDASGSTPLLVAASKDDAAQVNTLEQRFAAITPELVQEVAREYLRASNRTILTLQPGAAA